jgi:hypothetical protein
MSVGCQAQTLALNQESNPAPFLAKHANRGVSLVVKALAEWRGSCACTERTSLAWGRLLKLLQGPSAILPDPPRHASAVPARQIPEIK